MWEAFNEHPVVFTVLAIALFTSIVAIVGVIADYTARVRIAKHTNNLYLFEEEEN